MYHHMLSLNVSHFVAFSGLLHSLHHLQFLYLILILFFILYLFCLHYMSFFLTVFSVPTVSPFVLFISSHPTFFVFPSLSLSFVCGFAFHFAYCLVIMCSSVFTFIICSPSPFSSQIECLLITSSATFYTCIAIWYSKGMLIRDRFFIVKSCFVIKTIWRSWLVHLWSRCEGFR